MAEVNIHDNFDVLNERQKLQFIKDRYELIQHMLRVYFYGQDPQLPQRGPTYPLVLEYNKIMDLLDLIKDIEISDQLINHLMNDIFTNNSEYFHAVFGPDFNNFTQLFAYFREYFTILDHYFRGQFMAFASIYHYGLQDENPLDVDDLDAIFGDVNPNPNPNPNPGAAPNPNPGAAPNPNPAPVQQRQSARLRGEAVRFPEGVDTTRPMNLISQTARPQGARININGTKYSFDEAAGILRIINSTGINKDLFNNPLTDEQVAELRRFVNELRRGGKKNVSKRRRHIKKKNKTKGRKKNKKNHK